MPIPSPKKNEKKDDFISRCMGNPTMVKEHKDNKIATINIMILIAIALLSGL